MIYIFIILNGVQKEVWMVLNEKIINYMKFPGRGMKLFEVLVKVLMQEVLRNHNMHYKLRKTVCTW